MLIQLRERLGIPEEKLPIELKDCGNTVSSTLPILIDRLRRRGALTSEHRNLLIGFGVGWSWAGCVWKDLWNVG